MLPGWLVAQQDSTYEKKKDIIPINVSTTTREAFTPVASKVKLLSGGKFLSTDGVQFSYGYMFTRDTSNVIARQFENNLGVANYSMEGNLMLKGIPFDFSFDANNGFYTSGQNPFNDFYKMNFDPKRYKETLQKQVLSKIKPDLVLGSILTRINDIRYGYERRLQAELNQIQKDFTDQFQEDLTLPEGVSDLSTTDVSSIRNKILQGVSNERYNENLARLQELAKGKVTTSSTDSSLEAKKILRDIKKFEALHKVYASVITSKEKFEDNKLVKELKSHLPFTPDKFKSYLNKPGNLADVIKKHGDISSIQQLFLSLTKLDIGQNPVQNGELNMQNLVNTGVNTAFQSRKASVGIIAGTNNNTNYWMQSGLNSLLSNEYSGMTGITLGTGSSSKLNQSISVNVFNFTRLPGLADGPELLNPSYLSSPKRQDAVISYQTGFSIAQKHEISIDISRSMGSYRNNMNEDSSKYTNSAASSVFSSDGKSNFAAIVDYKGEVLNTGLHLAVKKVGLGYNNPGNVFLRRGETGLQMGINKRILKNKFTVSYKAEYRDQHFDPAKNYKYTSLSNKMQLGLRIKRNSRVSFSYQRTDYSSKMYLQPVGSGESSILQGNGSYKFMLFKKAIQNTATISSQHMKLPMPGAGDYNSRSILFVHNSSMLIHRNILILSFMGNQSNNKDYYFNTSFLNSELCYTYTLSEKLRSTSGTGYYVNKGWNNQVGLKQQLTISAMKKLDIDMGIDIKKAVRIIKPELANQIFVNASVHYSFN